MFISDGHLPNHRYAGHVYPVNLLRYESSHRVLCCDDLALKIANVDGGGRFKPYCERNEADLAARIVRLFTRWQKGRYCA